MGTRNGARFVNIHGAGFILFVACALAATGASAGTETSNNGDAASAPRRGNVLTVRKKASAPSPSHTPAVEGFVRLAAAGNPDALLHTFDEVPIRANGEVAIKHFVASEVIPFFADVDRLDGQMRVTEASFEDGSTGHMAYGYVVTTSGQLKPFVLAWRAGDSKLRVMDVQTGRCVKSRHPVTAGRCDR